MRAHHHEALVRPDSHHIQFAVRLQLFALGRDDQGRVLQDGTRLSDALFQALIRDVLGMRQSGVITAIVAQDNLRSMRLCRRNGLRSEVRYDGRHVRLTGLFTAT